MPICNQHKNDNIFWRLHFYSVGQVLSMIEVRPLVLAADPHLTAGGWGVGYMGAGLAHLAPYNPPIAHTGYVTACRLGEYVF